LVYSTLRRSTNYDQNIISQTMGIALDASKERLLLGVDLLE